MNFALKDKRKEQTPLIVYITNQGRFKYSPGIRIEVKHWDHHRKQVKRSHPNHLMINQNIRNIESNLTDLYLDAKLKGIVLTNQMIKDHLNKAIGIEKDDSQDLIKFIEKVIRQREMDSKFRESTIRQYRSTLEHLKKLAPIRFSDVDIDFFYNFLELFDGYAQNTKWNRVKQLKTFLRLAHERGLTDNQIYKSSEFSVKKAKRKDKFFYNEKVLDKLYRHRFESKKLDRVRDMFIILCWTGLRISDLPKVQLKNIDEHNLVITTQKTGQSVTVPLAPEVEAILSKYNNDLPIIADSNFNKYLKEMAHEAKLPNASRLTSHVGRISFACNLWIMGVPDKVICEFGGWASPVEYSKYLDGLTQKDHQEKLSKFWDDNKNVMKAI